MTRGSASCLARHRGPGPLTHRLQGHPSLDLAFGSRTPLPQIRGVAPAVGRPCTRILSLPPAGATPLISLATESRPRGNTSSGMSMQAMRERAGLRGLVRHEADPCVIRTLRHPQTSPLSRCLRVCRRARSSDATLNEGPGEKRVIACVDVPLDRATPRSASQSTANQERPIIFR